MSTSQECQGEAAGWWGLTWRARIKSTAVASKGEQKQKQEQLNFKP